MLRHLHRIVWLIVAAPVAASAQAPSATAAAAPSIAYVSSSRAFAASADGKAAETTVAALREKRARDIDRRNMTLKDLKRALDESGAAPGAPDRVRREREMDRVETELQRMLEDARGEVLALQEQLDAAFAAKLRPTVAAVARDRGLLLVLDEDAGGVVWAADMVDITADVVARINPR